MSDATGTAVAVRKPRSVTRLQTPKNETKKDKFRRLANIRAIAAVDALERLGNLGSSAYEYDESQVVTLEKAIKDAMNKAFAQLRSRTATRTAKREII